MTTSNKTAQFYDQVTALVDQSLATVLNGGSVASGNVDFATAIASTQKLLENFRDELKKDILELRDLAEWDTFTIAFYGETNAGKSTLIETLRILLGDTEKLAMQRQFMTRAKALRVDPHSVAALESSIRQLELQFTESQAKAALARQALQSEVQQQNAQLAALKAVIGYKRKNFSLWQKLVFLFKKLDEEKALPAQELQLVQFQAGNIVKLQAIDAEPLRIGAELEVRHKERAQVESSLVQLAPLQDGAIIGNGRSDFTLRSHTYAFEANGQKFQLIDVPGIEGDEKQVMGAIDASVKKAHAVFYVTRTASPPGSGSEGQEGTIGKIKRQLGKQTEVWAVYNKSATNPLVLQGETLINKNDSDGLIDMGKSLTDTLGVETYKGHICVSGMPAFLASASCLVPNNPHVKSREKFLAAMTVAEVQRRSGMDAFLQFVRTEICQNFKKKINNANLKKINSCVQDGIEHLQTARDNFANAAKKLDVQQKSAALQLDALLAGTSQKLKSECRNLITEKKTAMRREIYGYIDSDQSNDDFKIRLTADIDTFKTSVGEDLEARFAKVFEIFKQEAGEIIKKNQANVDEILHYTINDPFSSLKLSLNTDFKMSNGINLLGMLSSLGGAAGLAWAMFLSSNPAGWTISAVLAAVGLVFSFYKSVRGFFSTDYKKEQQRKSADENLDKVFARLIEMLDGNLESVGAKIEEVLVDTKNQMSLPYEQSVSTQEALDGIAAKLVKLRNKLVPKQTPTTIATSPVAA